MILDTSGICKDIMSNPEMALFINNIIKIIKLGVPIVLVLIGMIEFGKAVYANKEDEMKKVQNDFIKRLIAGAAVFLMITMVQLLMTILDRNSDSEIWKCANKIMNGGVEETENTNNGNSNQNTGNTNQNAENGNQENASQKTE